MDPGTVDVVEFVVALGVKIPLGLAIVGWDERRLASRHPDWLARAWPPASRLSALVVFQEIAIPIHFWRTRRSALGLLLGVLQRPLELAHVGRLDAAVLFAEDAEHHRIERLEHVGIGDNSPVAQGAGLDAVVLEGQLQ